MNNLEVVGYRCPKCGAELKFDIEKQGFSCEYCDSFLTKPQIEEIYPDKEFNPLDTMNTDKIEEEAARSEFAEFNSLYTCPGCGASVVTHDKNTASTFCHYCHSPIILAGRLSGEFKPDRIIPFKNTREKALESFEKRCRHKWFLPKDFKTEATLSYITALYVPYWLADVNIDASADATCETVKRFANRKQISVYECHRRAMMRFSKVPADSSKRIDDTLMASIEPFDYNEMTDFAMSYLSGIDAEKYDMDKNAVMPYLSESLGKEAVEQLSCRLNKEFNVVKVNNSSYATKRVDWLNTLFPVWFMNYQYKGKDFAFVMNGQTGKFSGALPVDKRKLWFATILMFLLFLAIFGAFFLLGVISE